MASEWKGLTPTRWIQGVDRMGKRIFAGTVAEAFRSVQLGSPITGAPGQPVGQYGPGYHQGSVGGTLRASWQVAFGPQPLSPATISTNVEYAPAIENGIGKYGPLRLRSSVGGFHSMKLTIAGYQRIVAVVVQREGGHGGR